MTRKEQNKILDDKIESNNNQYKIDRLNAEISAFSSGDLNKYEFLTRKDLNYTPNALDKVRFEFSSLGRAFNEGLDKTVANYQEEGVIKLLKGIRDNLAGGINIPVGLIIPPGPGCPPGPGGPPGEPGPPGPSSSQRPRIIQRLRITPKPSISGQTDDIINNLINYNNKKINDIVNNIKNKQSGDSINDIINNIGNKKFDDPADIDFPSSFNNLRDLVDNQTDKTDQIDENELLELTKAKLASGDLKPLIPLKPIDLSISRPPDTTRVKNISNEQEIKNIISSLEKNIKKFNEN